MPRYVDAIFRMQRSDGFGIQGQLRFVYSLFTCVAGSGSPGSEIAQRTAAPLCFRHPKTYALKNLRSRPLPESLMAPALTKALIANVIRPANFCF